MTTKLTLGEKLTDLRIKNNYSSTEKLSKALNNRISSSALSKYENIENENDDISAFNIAVLAKFYGVSTDYLLGLTDQTESLRTEFDDLHLSDKMIDILKDEKINHLLLAELLTHPNFRKFIIDSEVYVDQIAETHYQYANAIMSYSREVVIGKIHEELDLSKRTLELSQVDMGDFVLSSLHEDLDEILKDIRKKHEKDDSTVKANDELNQFIKQSEEVLNIVIKGEPKTYDDVVKIYCHVLKIKESMLTKDDRKVIKSFFMKSPTIRKALSQRGKAKKKYH